MGYRPVLHSDTAGIVIQDRRRTESRVVGAVLHRMVMGVPDWREAKLSRLTGKPGGARRAALGEVMIDNVASQGGGGVDVEFVEHTALICANGFGAQAEYGGDLPYAFSGCHAEHYFVFARGEGHIQRISDAQ